MVVGARAGDFGAVRVLRAGQAVLEAPLEGQRFQWPADAAPLAAGIEYELRLVPRGAAGDPAILRFVATAPGDPAEALVLLGVE